VRILIVEDSPLVQRMYGLAFPRSQHALTMVSNGREALELLDDPGREFDAVLLDLRMPVLNGVGFLEEVRKRPSLQSLPIVLTTSEAEGSELLSAARRLGPSAVVKKPWHPYDLRQLVESLCKHGPPDLEEGRSSPRVVSRMAAPLTGPELEAPLRHLIRDLRVLAAAIERVNLVVYPRRFGCFLAPRRFVG
jgi:CheY-like chemotaxis protein